MNVPIAQLERPRAMTRTRSPVRAIIAGTALLFDIFATRARPKKRRTPEDDARNLQGDLERIGQDFSRALSGIRTASDK